MQRFLDLRGKENAKDFTNRLKQWIYTCRSLWIAGRCDSALFGVVDDTKTTKFTGCACAVHCNSLPVVVVLTFPFFLGIKLNKPYFVYSFFFLSLRLKLVPSVFLRERDMRGLSVMFQMPHLYPPSNALPAYSSAELEQLQKRTMRIIFPFVPYSDALHQANLETLSRRRQSITTKLFDSITCNSDHKLHELLPPRNNCESNLRRKRNFNVPLAKTKRLKNTFIYSNCN